MNNADEKKPAEEKRYAQLSRSSIKLMAEQGGHAGISDLVATMLAEDSNYRIRELLHPVFGHNTNSTEPVNMTWVREAEVFAPESEDIDLLEYISTPAVVDLAPSPHIEGDNSSTATLHIMTYFLLTSNGDSRQIINIKLSPKKLPVGPDLMEYYNQITKAVLGNQDDMLKRLDYTVVTGGCVTAVCTPGPPDQRPHHPTAALPHQLCLHRGECSCLSYDWYSQLNLLVQSVLYCILEPLAACINPINDHWALRDMASHLLAHILKEWSTPHNNLRKNTVSALRNSFRDLSKPLCYHYGAVVGLLAIGVEVNTPAPLGLAEYTVSLVHVAMIIMAVSNCFYCKCTACLYMLKADIYKCSRASFGYLHSLMGLDLHKFHESMLLELLDNNQLPLQKLTCELILLNKMKKPFSDDLPRLYLQFYKLFGDVLSLHLPPINIPPSEIYTKPKPPEVSQLFNAPELLMTGEELLESFHEKEEDGKSSVAEEENSDESDIVSDNEEKVALRIKSTISDPTLGIKLTIAKLRKDRPPPPAASPPPPKRRIITLPLQPQDRQVFIPVTLRPHTHIEFCFEGSTPVPQHLLKMRQFRRDCPPPPLTHYRHLVKRLKPTAKLHKPPPRLIFRRKLMSGNLIN
ncbi:TAF6L, partial [Cordylochernes scorpioides]